MPPQAISVVDNAAATPVRYTFAGGLDLVLKAARATFDGSSAADLWRPALSLYAPGGTLLGRWWPSPVLVPGDSANVTFAEGAEATAGAGELVSTLPFRLELTTAGPVNVFASPVTVAWVAVNSGGLTTNVGFVIYDDAAGNQVNPVLEMAGPFGLGSNAKLPLYLRNGLTYAVVDATTGALWAGGERLSVSVGVTGATA